MKRVPQLSAENARYTPTHERGERTLHETLKVFTLCVGLAHLQSNTVLAHLSRDENIFPGDAVLFECICKRFANLDLISVAPSCKWPSREGRVLYEHRYVVSHPRTAFALYALQQSPRVRVDDSPTFNIYLYIHSCRGSTDQRNYILRSTTDRA